MHLPITEKEPAAVVDSILIKLLELFKHGLCMDDDTVAENVLALRVENAAGQQMKCILNLVDNDRVTGIGATVEPPTDIKVLGEYVD